MSCLPVIVYKFLSRSSIRTVNWRTESHRLNALPRLYHHLTATFNIDLSIRPTCGKLVANHRQSLRGVFRTCPFTITDLRHHHQPAHAELFAEMASPGNRMHWDLTTDFIATETERLTAASKAVYDLVGALKADEVTYENVIKVRAEYYTFLIICLDILALILVFSSSFITMG